MDAAGKRVLDRLEALTSVRTEDSLTTLEVDIAQYTKLLTDSLAQDTGNVPSESIDELLYGKIIANFLKALDANFPIFSKKLSPTIENLLIIKSPNFLITFELLTSIADFLKRSKNEESVKFVLSIIEKLLKNESFSFSIMSACRPRSRLKFQVEEHEAVFNNYVQTLVSLPVVVSNRLQGQIPDTFLIKNFATIVSYQIVRSISLINEEILIQNTLFSLKPLAHLMSKLFLNLGSPNFVNLIKIFVHWSLEEKPKMSTTVNNILLNIPRASIAPIAILLLENIQDPNNVEKLFKSLMRDQHWNRIISTKLVLFSYFKNDRLIVNLVNCLTCNAQTEFVELIKNVLDIWGDESALNHTSVEQHEYISKILILSLRKLAGKLSHLEVESIREILFSGIPGHLKHMDPEVRSMGMITSELISDCLTKSDAPKLRFEEGAFPVEGKVTVDKFRRFWRESCEGETTSIDGEIDSEKLIEELGVTSGILEKNKIAPENTEIPNASDLEIRIDEKLAKIEISKNEDESSLDSDDDLLPYDMSNDFEISKARPLYLRDLKENLINFSSTTDPSVFEKCLECSEELIATQLPNDDSSFAVELLAIFSQLSQKCYVENFGRLKFRACATIAKIFPKESAEYLCREFHAPLGSHSIANRLFFLEVLAEAARQLSKVEMKNEEIGKPPNLGNAVSKPLNLSMSLEIGKRTETLFDDDFEVSQRLNDEDENRTLNNQEILAKRIQSNTKIFAHKSKRYSTTINRFNDVASHFFYPLLYGLGKGDGRLFNTPKNFEDQENILLINFVKTLSTIMVAAENCIAAPKMAGELLELGWNLRFHEQSAVRNCVVESIAAVIVAVSRQDLTGEIFHLLLEMRSWLGDVCQESVGGDPSAECRATARNVIGLIDSLFPGGLSIKGLEN